MSVRSQLSRVQKLEAARAFRSPFALAFGSFDAFAAECESDMAAGKLDPTDFPVVLQSLRGWETNGTWRRQ